MWCWNVYRREALNRGVGFRNLYWDIVVNFIIPNKFTVAVQYNILVSLHRGVSLHKTCFKSMPNFFPLGRFVKQFSQRQIEKVQMVVRSLLTECFYEIFYAKSDIVVSFDSFWLLTGYPQYEKRKIGNKWRWKFL